MNLIRKYKIHQITPVWNEQELEIINFVKGKISTLVEFKDNNHPKSLFYMNSEGEYILEFDDINKILYVRHDGFWEVLETKYHLNYITINLIIRCMVELTFKRKGYSPRRGMLTRSKDVELTFKQYIIPHINTKI
jgi:hypothetical protein